MGDPTLDTASQRSATGLDPAARKLILQIVDEVPSASVSATAVRSPSRKAHGAPRRARACVVAAPRAILRTGSVESARAELALGTPKALSQSVHQSGCAIESAMKVVLDERRIAYDAKDTAQRLFENLTQNGIVTRDMERLVLGAATPRNKKGGHGAGATPHQVRPADAEAVLASAAVAIAYLHKKLP